MFEQKLEKITLSGMEFPIKIDNFVLEKLQKKYGTLQVYEMLLTGKRKDKEDKIFVTEPSLEAINFTVPLMIQEGMEIEGKEAPTTEEIVRMIDIPMWHMAQTIQTEFSRCFETKKLETTQKKSLVKKIKSILRGLFT